MNDSIKVKVPRVYDEGVRMKRELALADRRVANAQNYADKAQLFLERRLRERAETVAKWEGK